MTLMGIYNIKTIMNIFMSNSTVISHDNIHSYCQNVASERLLHAQLSFSPHMHGHMFFQLQRGLDIHLSNQLSLSGLLRPHCSMTSLKPLPLTAVILLHWAGHRQTPRTQPYG